MPRETKQLLVRIARLLQRQRRRHSQQSLLQRHPLQRLGAGKQGVPKAQKVQVVRLLFIEACFIVMVVCIILIVRSQLSFLRQGLRQNCRSSGFCKCLCYTFRQCLKALLLRDTGHDGIIMGAACISRSKVVK